MIVPILVLEGTLGGLVLSHLILQRCQRAPQIGIAGLCFQGISPHLMIHARGAGRYAARFVTPDGLEPAVASASGAIHPVADRVLLGVVLMVLLGRIERAGREDL